MGPREVSDPIQVKTTCQDGQGVTGQGPRAWSAKRTKDMGQRAEVNAATPSGIGAGYRGGGQPLQIAATRRISRWRKRHGGKGTSAKSDFALFKSRFSDPSAPSLGVLRSRGRSALRVRFSPLSSSRGRDPLANDESLLATPYLEDNALYSD